MIVGSAKSLKGIQFQIVRMYYFLEEEIDKKAKIIN